MPWPSDVIDGNVIFAADINAAYSAVRSWGGNVAANGFSLTGVGTVVTTVLQSEQAQPTTIYRATGGAADQKYWRTYVSNNDGSSFTADVVNDAFSAGTPWLHVIRSGMGISSVVFPNGNVGIGVPTPLRPLHVFRPGAAAVDLAISNGVTNTYLSSGADGHTTLQNQFGYALRFATDGVVRLHINGSGNAAFGTESPLAARLTVIGPGDAQIAFSNDAANYYTIGRQASTGYMMLYGNQVGFSGYRFFVNAATEVFAISNNGAITMHQLPSSNPGAGSKQIWFDPADGNRVKFAP